jgi:hypothetical protein
MYVQEGVLIVEKMDVDILMDSHIFKNLSVRAGAR